MLAHSSQPSSLTVGVRVLVRSFASLRVCVCTGDAHRALELLEEYHAQLKDPADKPLRTAIERIIRIFRSRLFQALLGMYRGVAAQK